MCGNGGGGFDVKCSDLVVFSQGMVVVRRGVGLFLFEG